MKCYWATLVSGTLELKEHDVTPNIVLIIMWGH